MFLDIYITYLCSIYIPYLIKSEQFIVEKLRNNVTSENEFEVSRCISLTDIHKNTTLLSNIKFLC